MIKIIQTQIIPNAKRERIVEQAPHLLKIWVHSPPIDNKANHSVIEKLARYYKTKKNKITLIKGAKNRNKTFQIVFEK